MESGQTAPENGRIGSGFDIAGEALVEQRALSSKRHFEVRAVYEVLQPSP
jgi:hypothetical protein